MASRIDAHEMGPSCLAQLDQLFNDRQTIAGRLDCLRRAGCPGGIFCDGAHCAPASAEKGGRSAAGDLSPVTRTLTRGEESRRLRRKLCVQNLFSSFPRWLSAALSLPELKRQPQ